MKSPKAKSTLAVLLGLSSLLVGWTALPVAAWEIPNGAVVPLNTGFSTFPDPAAGGVGAYGAQLYSTYVKINNQAYNIPSETWNPPGTTQTTCCYDALQQLPTGITVGNTWAPSVAFIGGHYVMWFSALPGTQGAELDSVVSSSALTGFMSAPGTAAYYWSANPSYGMLDPGLFQDHAGNWWLDISVQNPANDNNDELYAAELTSNGEQLATGFYALLDYPDIRNALAAAPYNISAGSNGRIENPAFVTDPQGTYPYNLMLSFGTYYQQNDYRTINVACNAPTGPCGWNVAEMANFNSQVNGNDPYIQNSGGASVVEGSSWYSEYYLPFAAAAAGGTPGPRAPYFDGTNSGVLYEPQTLVAGKPLQGLAFCICDPNAWSLQMQPDGNLVIYNQNNIAQWSSGTSGGDANSYAEMQPDGNFVVHDDGVARWSTGTANHGGAHLAFQNADGNLVVYAPNGQALWASGT